MEIRVDGSRSSSENWLRAAQATDLELPVLSSEEELVAKKLGIDAEEYARSRYAVELTDGDLRERALRVGDFVQAWLETHGLQGTVASIWLKTFEGKYRFEVELQKKRSLIFVDEDLIDEMLEEGSTRAKHSLEHLLRINLLPSQMVRAS